MDALAVIVNMDNPIDCMPVEELATMYEIEAQRGITV